MKKLLLLSFFGIAQFAFAQSDPIQNNMDTSGFTYDLSTPIEKEPQPDLSTPVYIAPNSKSKPNFPSLEEKMRDAETRKTVSDWVSSGSSSGKKSTMDEIMDDMEGGINLQGERRSIYETHEENSNGDFVPKKKTDGGVEDKSTRSPTKEIELNTSDTNSSNENTSGGFTLLIISIIVLLSVLIIVMAIKLSKKKQSEITL